MPYVCSNCRNRYNKNCIFVKFKYDSKINQREAVANLINSKSSIDLNEFIKLDFIIKKVLMPLYPTKIKSVNFVLFLSFYQSLKL